MSETILLSIAMLVSNREDSIEKCLRSLEHLREAVPSELIVVDTAENQTCMDIVRRYTNLIVPFQWCDDFAAARNAGLKKARGQWVMYLDDDEWFESTQELEHFFLSGDYNKYYSAAYIQRNYTDFEGSRWTDTDVLRIARRQPDLHFYGRIHEIFMPLYEPTCFLKDYVHHYGYVYRTRQDQNRHSWRNIRLLQEMCKENPQDCHAAAQLIQEYCSAKEYFSALEWCGKIYRVKGCWDIHASARYGTYAVMTETKIYFLQERYADGFQAGEKLLAQKDIAIKRPLTVLARGILYNRMAGFSLYLQKYAEALEYIDYYMTCLKEWEAFPKQKELDAFSDCAVLMSSREIVRLCFIRLHIYVLQKEWEKAGRALQAVDWTEKDMFLLSETPSDICEVLLAMGDAVSETVMNAFSAVYLQENMRPLLYKAVDCQEADKKEVLLSYLSRLSPQDPQLCFYRFLHAAKQADAQGAKDTLEIMSRQNYPLLINDTDYWEGVYALNININAYLAGQNIYNWLELAKQIFQAADPVVCEKAYMCLQRGLEKTDLRYLYVNALFLEKRLLGAETDMYPAERIWKELYQLAQCWVSCAAMLYREDVFMGELFTALPPCYQFGWLILQANALKGNDPGAFIHKVADAAKAYPNLKELCKKVIRES